MRARPERQASLCAWLSALPDGVLARYMLELREFDNGLRGVVPAIELIRAEFRRRELGAVCGAVGHAPASSNLTLHIKDLIDRCRAHQQHTVDLRARSVRAVARLDTALGFAQPVAID